MFATRLLCLSKRVVVPQLSPTHTAVRIVQMCVTPEQSLSANDVFLILECSEDFLSTENRNPHTPHVTMIVETQDEGTVHHLKDDWTGQWLPVGTQLAILDDEEPVDGDWMWQAYLHNETTKA
jgi:hypothetical protein